MAGPQAYLDDALRVWAADTPNAAALSFAGQTLSYGQLDAQADAVAAFLIWGGMARGDRVIIHAAKSTATIAAVYGVLRAGGVYVPIDPGAPADRIAACISATEPHCILADGPRVNHHATTGPVYPCHDVTTALNGLPDGTALAARQRDRQHNDPAYILLTSGTTGTPKGILHTHKSGLAYARMAADLCALTPTDRVSHHTPLHFDMSIFDIFSTALAGACCVIIPEMYTKIPASLAQLTEAEEISVWYSVPYALTKLVARGGLAQRDLSALRIVMFAGEAMPPATIKEFAAHTPNARFLNAYGPTETNHCTTALMQTSDLDGITALPIGLPAAEITARIDPMDADPDKGELLIAGDQVMAGYWNDAARTRAAFVTLPDPDGVSRDYYRTGDMVERRADGSLQLLGRADRQIKLRGYRIELDEIEHALTTAPKVREAAVILHRDAIWAFVTGVPQEGLEDVKATIARRLPAYALPEHLIALDHLNRTSTGKIDRRALIGQVNDQTAA